MKFSKAWHQRLCLGAFRTSATSPCVAANDPLNELLKLGSNQQNPTHNVVLNAKFKSSFERKPKQIPPLSIRVSCDLKDVGFQKRNVLSSNIISTPPWLLTRPIVNYSLHSADKADIPAEIHKYRFYELCYQYADYCRIYTVGSKTINQYPFINQKLPKRTVGYKMGEINVNIAYNNKIEIQI